MASKHSECVKVVMRCRPLSTQEKTDGRQSIVQMDAKRGEVSIHNKETNEPPQTFTFDSVYDSNAKQSDIYKETAHPIVESVLQGYNGTIFAYGQTGTGKTHTMEGQDNPPQSKGIIPRTFDHIFNTIKGSPHTQFLVRASFLELYNQEIRDLLSKNTRQLEIREKPGSGIYVKDLSAFMIQNVEEMVEKLLMGRENRVTGATNMNQDSSRSHSLFAITIETAEDKNGQGHIRVGKLNLVDLAGSERQSKTGATGDRFKEAININQSLTTLGNVISALIDPKGSHVPYRDSKLTRLLQDSLGGNTKTVMIANIGPADYNYDETISTLRYASRAKSIQNKPKINQDPQDALIRQFQEEINKLKQQLQSAVDGDITTGSDGKVITVEKIVQVEDEESIKQLEKKIQLEKEEIAKRAEEERQKIEAQKNLAESEKIKLLQQLKEKEQEEKAAKEVQQRLLKKIKKMEEKVLHGSELMEQALMKDRELAKAQREIEEKREVQQKLQEELREKEMLTADINRKYLNQKQEVEEKTKRIKQLFGRLKQLQGENRELDQFYASEIEQLQQRRRALTQQLKLKNLILEYFIPEKELERLQLRAVFKDEIDDWIYPHLELAGNLMRAQQNEEREKKKDDIPPQEMDEVMKLQREGHPNVYFVYTDDGLVREEELAPHERQPIRPKSSQKPLSAKKRPGSKTGKRPESGVKQATSTIDNFSQPPQQTDEDNFPQAKGLVKQ